MSIPDAVRDDIRDRLWAAADTLRWSTLPDTERAKYYVLWTRDPAIGGRIGHYMDPRRVRVYIKDSLIKPYERSRLLLIERDVWRLLSVPDPGAPAHRYIKPHGRRLPDGKVVCWGNSRDWKHVLMAVFERARARPSYEAFGAVLLESGRTVADDRRRLVREAAARLGIENIAWLE